VLQNRNRIGLQQAVYCEELSEALKRELGVTHQAVKTLMRWTGASERTAKYWLSGERGPSGENLIVLLSRSEEVLKSVLYMADRSQLLATSDLIAAREGLLSALSAVDELFEASPSNQTESIKGKVTRPKRQR